MSKIKTHEDFLKKLFDLVGEEYSPLSEYVNSKTKLKMKHNKCGFKYEVLSGNILKGRKCPKCQKRVKTKDTEYLKREIYEAVGNEYTLNGEYVNSRTKVSLTHNKCGYTYETTPNDFQQGKRCPKCAGNLKRTNEQFVKEVIALVGDEYVFLEEYKSGKNKMQVLHKECNMKYEVTANNFIHHNRRCPYCKMSKGEKRIKEFLDKHKIKHKFQFVFDDLISLKGNKLKFDFVIIDEKYPFTLIEHDGEFHFKKKSHVTEIEFQTTKIHDEMKNVYCKMNNIPLIRIPYWEFERIEIILNESLKQIPR